MAKVDWKALTSGLAQMHNRCGHALSVFGAVPPAWTLVDMPHTLRVGGKTLSVKKIREWAWQNRNLRAFRRVPIALWSVYDGETGESVVGVGAAVTPQVALRMGRPLMSSTDGQGQAN